MPWTAVLLLLCCLVAAAGAVERTRVYVVLVDGLDAAFVSEALTPTLWGLARGPGGAATFYPAGRAVMPSVTTTNHAAVMTASYTAAHGLVGNRTSDRVAGAPPVGTADAPLLEVETLFTVIERERPRLGTAALLGKSRLVRLFAATAVQRRPDVLWGDVTTETEGIDGRVGFGSDHRTMDEALRTIALHDPDLLFVALPDVDRTAHVFGPTSAPARRAVVTADAQIARLIAAAKAQRTWERTVLIVTADHGMQSVAPDPAAGRPYPMVSLGRELARAGIEDVAAVSNGSTGSLFLLDGRAGEARADERLATVRRLVLEQPEVAEAWYREPNARDGGDAFTLASARPEWRLAHPRAGDLVVVARPGHHFVDPFSAAGAGLLGNHGGPEQTTIPILVAGGDPRIRAQVVAPSGDVPQAANPDIGATVAWLLDVPMPRTVGGAAVRPAFAGRVLHEAFTR